MKSIKRHSSVHIWGFVVVIISILVYGYLNNYFSRVVNVHIKYGTLQGFEATSRDGRPFFSFRRIPYAKPPIGRMRFQPPAEIEPWDGVRDATKMTPNCLQYDLAFKAFRGQEDCLFLNIDTPQDPTRRPFKKLLPVMVFIHGGLFMFGGSGELYGGRYFMDQDVVFVTINYRLGLLGFLNTGDDFVTGNMGLKDQLEALKFIKSTIMDFGGDPNSITLFGESAGGVSVHLHMLSSQSKGYFNRAISQSGSSFCPWAFTRNPREQAIRLGNQVGCPTTNSEKLVECLTLLDPWELIRPHEKLSDIFMDAQDVYGPSVENATRLDLKSNAFLTDYPYKLAAEGKTHRIPWISGSNSHEGCFRSAWFVGHKPHLDRLNQEWDNVASDAFFLHQNDSKTLDKLRTYHFGEKTKEITTSDYEALTHLVGDRLFTIPARDAALLHAKSGAPTYLYYFTQKPDYSVGDFIATLSDEGLLPRFLQIIVNIVKKEVYRRLRIAVPDYGTCHADEILQFMSVVPTSVTDITYENEQYEFSKALVQLWVTFAATGDPGDFNGVPWEKVNLPVLPNTHKNISTASMIPKYMLFNAKEARMVSEPYHSRLAAWRELSLPRNLAPEQEAIYNQDVLLS